MNNRKLSREEHVFALQIWWKCDRNYQAKTDSFVEKFPHTQPPCRQALYKLNRRFELTGSVCDLPRSGRPKSVTTEDNLQLVAQTFIQSPKKSAKRAAMELQISDRSVRRMLKILHLKPYKLTLLHALNEDDPDRRREFCEWYVIRSESDPNFYKKILWSDEACFKLNGRVNKHNCVYWSSENPRFVIEEELNVPGVTVWARIFSKGVIGPYFFDGTVNAERYLEMLREVIIELDNTPLLEDIRNIIWQQDGAPPHYGLNVRAFLVENFQEWIGRRGKIDWPPRSPDLTPCDFSMWGILKDKVYAMKPFNLQHLRDLIEQQFVNIFGNDKKLCDRICKSVFQRCVKCLDNNGGHFEHLQ